MPGLSRWDRGARIAARSGQGIDGIFKVVIDTFQFAAVFALSALLTVLTLTARDVRPDRRKAILSLFCFLSLYSLSEIGWSTGALHRAIGWLSMAMPLLAGPILLWSARAGAARPLSPDAAKGVAAPHPVSPLSRADPATAPASTSHGGRPSPP